MAITATNSATPSVQAYVGRARLEQARRQADQAEANARDLRAQADDAEQQAQQSQNNVRKISASIQNEDTTYSAPRSTNESAVPVKVQKLIEQLYRATSEKRDQDGNPLKSDPRSPSVVNALGQKTGRIVNVSA